MRFGNIRIKGVSKRFYFILGALVLLLIASQAFKSTPPVQTNPAVDPVFALSKLNSPALQKSGWTGNFISAYGLQHPSQMGDFVGTNYPLNLGAAVRFKVYLLDPTTTASTRPDLYLHENGYTF